MGAYSAVPIEVVKYLKFPDRRLISGFLTINAIHHNDNDTSFDDSHDEYYEHWDTDGTVSQAQGAIQNATPFNGVRPDDPARTGHKLTFGDFDCMLFWVAGGMTLQTPTNIGVTQTLTGYEYTDGNWYTGVLHPCQHFMKHHLIGRINNGYGHTNTNYSKITPIRQDTFEIDDDTDASKRETGVGAPVAFASDRKGQWSRYVLSNGIFSEDSDADAPINLSTDTNNTFSPMIEGVEIYGKHNYNIPANTKGGSPTFYSVNPGGSYDGADYVHQDSFWSLVIKIKYRGYNSNHPDSGDTQADKEFFKSRTNIMFQPFGETASFSFADSLHTS